MWKKISLIILISGILIFSVKSLLAQPPVDSVRKEKMRERIETLRLWKMIEFLDLSSEQSDEFLPLLHEFHKAQKELEMSRRRLFNELEENLELKEPDEKNLQQILLGLEQNKADLEKQRIKFLTNSKKVLTPVQEAKLILFEHVFEKQLRDTIRKFRVGPGRHCNEG